MTTESVAARSVAVPADPITLDESVTMALLVVLESMTPAQRVAVILHDVFRYSHDEVAEITGRTPAECRQLASSAQHRVHALPAPAAPDGRRAGLVSDFGQAWEVGDIDAMIGLLHPCATAIPGGRGLVRAALCPIEGDERVAQYLVDLASAFPGLTIAECTVNGQPGLAARHGGVSETAFAFDVEGDRIIRIWAPRHPAG